MNILFLTVVRIGDVEEKGIYTDLIRQFRDKGHEVYIVCPEERRHAGKTRLEELHGVRVLYVRSLNIQKTNIAEKGLATLSLSHLLLRAVRKYLSSTAFDLVLYSTPPITYNRVLRYLKKKDGAKTYLLLKDIFPQNAVDLGMMQKGSLLHRYFTGIEKKLYRYSDYIGCMSPANVAYLKRHHPQIPASRIEINPNSIDAKWLVPRQAPDPEVRRKWNIPEDAYVFIYGGNLGKPQGIDFLLQVMHHYRQDRRVFFVVAGSGTEYERINTWVKEQKPANSLLLKSLPKADYDALAQACDAGLIFLHPHFTIPNFPSRLLSYLENQKPVLAATDVHTDIRQVLEDNQIGLWARNGDLEGFIQKVEQLLENKEAATAMGARGYRFLQEHYLAGTSCQIILNHFGLS